MQLSPREINYELDYLEKKHQLIWSTEIPEHPLAITYEEPRVSPADTERSILALRPADLNETSRLKFSIKESIASGVVVADVDQDSPAADKHIQPGEVIEEVNQEPVKTPADVVGKLHALKDSGKKLALLLVANPQGDVRFVAVALK